MERSLSLLADNFSDAKVVLNAQSTLQALRQLWFAANTREKMATRWALKDARKMTKWDARNEVLCQFSVFKNDPQDPA